MKTKRLIGGIVIAAAVFNVWAEPGGTYTLTGKEKSIEEIVKADVAKHPDLYKGENINIYIGKFKNRNRIGKRKLYPGGQLHFPETRASLAKKKAVVEEEKQQAEEKEQAAYVSFTTTYETGWLERALFDNLLSKIKREGLVDKHWPSTIEGRCVNEQNEYLLKYEPVPEEGIFYYHWIYAWEEEDFEKEKKKQENNGLNLIHHQSFTNQHGRVKHQAIWRKHED